MANNAPRYTDRTIYDFRSRLTGGGARANLFECVIPFPTSVLQQIEGSNANDLYTDLRFLIKAAQLPGSTINSIPVPFRGRTLKLAGDRTYEPWTITVLNDTNFRIRDAFEKWSNYMNRHEDNAGAITPNTYQTDISVYQLSRGNEASDAASPVNSQSNDVPRPVNSMKILKGYKLYGCFPTSIDPIPLSYDSSDSIEEFNVTFEVQWWDALKPDGTTIFSGQNPNQAVDGVSGTLGQQI
jgi:hypothetical protein